MMEDKDKTLDLEEMEALAIRNHLETTHPLGVLDMYYIKSICRSNFVYTDGCECKYDYLLRINEMLSPWAINKLKTLYDL